MIVVGGAWMTAMAGDAKNIGAISMMSVSGSMIELYVNSVNLLTRIKTVDIYA